METAGKFPEGTSNNLQVGQAMVDQGIIIKTKGLCQTCCEIQPAGFKTLMAQNRKY